MNPNLRQLRAFVSVYRLGSLTRAAEQIFVTQPTISVLIRQLEESIGVRLFDRTTRSLRPTAAAHESIARAERILEEFEQLVAGFKDVATRRRGQIKVGATPAVASVLLPAAVLEFRRRFPGVIVTLHDVAPEHLIASVADSAVEFGIGTPDGPLPEFDLATLVEDRICAICVRDFPLARRRGISWSEIVQYPTVTTRKGSGIRTLIDDTLSRLGLPFTPAYEVSYLSTALSLTARGLGVSILPSYLARHFHGGKLAAIRLVNPVVTRNLCVVTRRDASITPAAQSFIEVLRSQIRTGAPAR